MGTNFYFEKPGGDDLHIGKRSAAGLYCWDCKGTLCKGGKEKIHQRTEAGDWYGSCPCCGKSAEPEPLSDSTAGRELGFNKSEPAPKHGVASCSSFSWAIEPGAFCSLILDGLPIKDEYGRGYMPDEFLKMLEECPLRFCHSVGTEFS